MINDFFRWLQSNRSVKEFMPQKQGCDETQDCYEKIMLINDFVPGMTDTFAVTLYKKLTGIALPK